MRTENNIPAFVISLPKIKNVANISKRNCGS